MILFLVIKRKKSHSSEAIYCPPLLQDGMVQVSVFRNPNSSHWMTLKGLKSTHLAETFSSQGTTDI